MVLHWLQQLWSKELAEVLAGCWSLASLLAAYRMRRWLALHLERERQREQERIAREFERHNETLRILSSASEIAERPTLESLLADEKRDWSLESSPMPYVPVDWSDDHETTTTLPETPAAKRRRPSSEPPEKT